MRRLLRSRRPDRYAALPAPRRDQGVHPSNVLIGQVTCPACEQPPANHPAPDGLRQRSQPGDIQPRGRLDVGQCPPGQVVEGVGVLTKRGCGAGQRFGDPAAEHVLQQWQHLGAQPAAGEPAIGVVRVLPR